MAVSGFFNGAEGDVSPDWLVQDRDDVLTFAHRLATAVTTLLASSPQQQTGNPAFETRWSKVRYDGACGD